MQRERERDPLIHICLNELLIYFQFVMFGYESLLTMVYIYFSGGGFGGKESRAAMIALPAAIAANK